MFYAKEPEGFKPDFSVASCFLEYDGEILLLLRQNEKHMNNMWGIPTGKIEKGETPLMGMRRELFEETGIRVKRGQLRFFTKCYMIFPGEKLIAYIFSLKLDSRPKIVIDPNEHKDFKWATPRGALDERFVTNLDDWIRVFYGVTK